MPPHRVVKLLADVRASCDAIADVIGKRSPIEAMTVRRDRASILYELMIVGEALGQASKLDETLGRDISQLAQIIAFRNRIVHGYDAVTIERVAQIIADDLPVLRVEVERALGHWGGAT